MGRITDYEGMSKEQLIEVVSKVKQTFAGQIQLNLPNEVEIRISESDDLKTGLILAETEAVTHNYSVKDIIKEKWDNCISTVRLSSF